MQAGRTFFDFVLEPQQRRNRRPARPLLQAHAIDTSQNVEEWLVGDRLDAKAEVHVQAGKSSSWDIDNTCVLSILQNT